MNNIDYFKNKKNSSVIKFLKYYNKYKEGNFNSKEIKELICILIKNNKIIELEEVLKELFENYKYDRDYEFDEYFEYDDEFIIKLLMFYKSKIQISKKEFKMLLIKEKEYKSNSVVNFNIINDYHSDCDKYPDETITPLHLACFFISKDIINLLIKYGGNINIKNNKGYTPLNYTCYYYGQVDIIKLLIDCGANLHIPDNDGNTPFISACGLSSLEVVKLLHNYTKNINIKNKFGETPLMFICGIYYDKIENIKYLIECGADLNITNSKGNTPLLELCQYSNKYEYIPILVKNGVDINKTNNKGETALLITCKRGYYYMAKMLVQCGADINKTDYDGNTPLFEACRNIKNTRETLLLTYLIENGADVNKANNKGETPLHKVCYWADKDTIKLFIEHGGDFYKKNNYNNTPLSSAYLTNKPIIGYLKEYGII